MGGFCIPTSDVDKLSFRSRSIPDSFVKLSELQPEPIIHTSTSLGSSFLCKTVQHKYRLLHFSFKNFRSAYAQDILLSLILDTIFGILLITPFMNDEIVQSTVNRSVIKLTNSSVDRLEKMIHFMTNTPIGLKLNLPLANFLGQLFLYHLYVWLTWVKLLQPGLPYLFQVGVLASVMGVTIFVSLLFDLFQFMTLHLFCFYLYAVRLYSFTLHSLYSLSLLFRGKKSNPLRKRVDNNEYETDQFLLGSLLFTTFLFLFPTIAVFYVVFAAIQITFSGIKIVILQLATSIYQPYCSLIRSVVRPDSFYSSVYLVKCAKTGCYAFKKKPLTFVQILTSFYQILPPYWFPLSPPKVIVAWCLNIVKGVSIDF